MVPSGCLSIQCSRLWLVPLDSPAEWRSTLRLIVSGLAGQIEVRPARERDRVAAIDRERWRTPLAQARPRTPTSSRQHQRRITGGGCRCSETPGVAGLPRGIKARQPKTSARHTRASAPDRSRVPAGRRRSRDPPARSNQRLHRPAQRRRNAHHSNTPVIRSGSPGVPGKELEQLAPVVIGRLGSRAGSCAPWQAVIGQPIWAAALTPCGNAIGFTAERRVHRSAQPSHPGSPTVAEKGELTGVAGFQPRTAARTPTSREDRGSASAPLSGIPMASTVTPRAARAFAV